MLCFYPEVEQAPPFLPAPLRKRKVLRLKKIGLGTVVQVYWPHGCVPIAPSDVVFCLKQFPPCSQDAVAVEGVLPTGWEEGCLSGCCLVSL